MTELSNVKFIRLENGDDIIAEVVELSDDNNLMYHLINPLKISYVPSGKTGYMHVAFIPWIFPKITNKQEYTLQSDKVLLLCDVSDSMNEYYWNNIEEFLTCNESEDQNNEYNDSDLLSEVLQALAQKRTFH